MELDDPTLHISAELLDDIERSRVANENRLRQLTRAAVDSDGEERGFGLSDSHPVVVRVAALVEGLQKLEAEAISNLQKIMKAHPLGPWVKAQPGVGEKQMARLLAAIGDPYIRPEVEKGGVVQPSRPRTVSELWAYSGMHVWDLPVDGHEPLDAQTPTADNIAHTSSANNQASNGHTSDDAQIAIAGIAPFRQRGTRINWSEDARKRVRLIANSCIKQPNGTVWRDAYVAGRAKYANAVHKLPCKRCGPAGKPAPIGSELSAGHKDARARRLVAKGILKELWRESGRLHGADTSAPTTSHSTPQSRTSTIAAATPNTDAPPVTTGPPTPMLIT
jgi:hypothetical protein